MEFMQFYPWRLISYVTGRMPVQPSSFVAGAVLRNADGERFMPRYDPERGDATTRDIAARAIYTEILEGRGVHGGVRLDLSQAPLEEFIRLNPRVGRYFSDPRARPGHGRTDPGPRGALPDGRRGHRQERPDQPARPAGGG